MKTILLSGSTGFLGRMIYQTLSEFDITTVGRNNSNITCDLSTVIPKIPPVDLVVHAAGKAHTVPNTLEEAESFYKVNVEGTKNLLLGLEQTNVLPRYFVFISSVAVYGETQGWLITEEHSTTATDAYGKSKAEAENLIQEWCIRNNVLFSILRLPLIAGHNPPGNLKAMIKGIRKGYYFDIAQGGARKSMVLAADVAQVIPTAAKMGGVFNLTDGFHPSFSELSGLIAMQLGKRKPTSIPFWLAKLIAKIGDIVGAKAPINSDKLRKITSDLTFDDSKARLTLGWSPTPVLKGFRVK